MSRTNVFRDGKVHVQAAKCSTCIYRPHNLMHLDPGRKDQMQATAIEGGGVIPCHQTLSEDHSVCRGFFDVAKHEGLLALAERLDVVEFTPCT